MKKLTLMLCAAAMTLTSLAAPVVSVSAAPLQPVKVATPSSDIQQVRIRRGFYRGGFYGPRRFYRRGAFRGYGPGYRYRRGDWLPGAFIAGAIIGGAIAGPSYGSYYGGYGPYRGYAYPYERCNNWHEC